MAITRTAKGTNQVKNFSGTAWTAFTALSIAGGASIIIGVCMHDSSIGSVVWNSLTLNLDSGLFSPNANTRVGLFSLHGVTGASGNVVVNGTISGQDTAIFVIEVTGLLSASVLDKQTGTTGSSGTPSSGATATTAQNDEFICGVVGTNGPQGDTAGTWGNDITNDGQRVGTTGGGATSNCTVSEGFAIQTATGARTASKSGMTSRDWACLIATYKAQTGSTFNEAITLAATSGLALAFAYIANPTLALAATSGFVVDPAGSIYNPTLAIAAASGFAPVGTGVFDKAIALAAASGFLAQGGLSLSDAITLAATASMTQTVTLTIDAVLGLAATATLTPGEQALMQAALSLAANAQLTPAAAAVFETIVGLSATSGFTAAGGMEFLAALALAANAGLALDYQYIPGGGGAYVPRFVPVWKPRRKR